MAVTLNESQDLIQSCPVVHMARVKGGMSTHLPLFIIGGQRAWNLILRKICLVHRATVTGRVDMRPGHASLLLTSCHAVNYVCDIFFPFCKVLNRVILLTAFKSKTFLMHWNVSGQNKWHHGGSNWVTHEAVVDTEDETCTHPFRVTGRWRRGGEKIEISQFLRLSQNKP